ncbi:MAG: paraslipin [Proteobacteria bacterium]|nr:paraslipin [Pseudomonadota bacterium]
MLESPFLLAVFLFVVVAIFFVTQAFRIVPQQTANVVERFGQYHRTLNAGPHIIVPFMDTVRYRHSLKELVIDVPEQVCITKDNVQVKVDGVLFLRVMYPAKASYGVSDYVSAVIQLAQTTLRSEMGKLELDRTFEEREYINNSVVRAIDPATDPWGVKVLRYELKSIQPPKEILDAMEKQMRAEREKRAKILESEGDRDSRVNRAEGEKQETIKGSEAEKQLRINEAEGEAAAIMAVAKATAGGIELVAAALNGVGGRDAANLRVAEEYVKQFGSIAKQSTTMIIPSNLTDVAGMVATALNVIKKVQPSELNKN